MILMTHQSPSNQQRASSTARWPSRPDSHAPCSQPPPPPPGPPGPRALHLRQTAVRVSGGRPHMLPELHNPEKGATTTLSAGLPNPDLLHDHLGGDGRRWPDTFRLPRDWVPLSVLRPGRGMLRRHVSKLVICFPTVKSSIRLLTNCARDGSTDQSSWDHVWITSGSCQDHVDGTRQSVAAGSYPASGQPSSDGTPRGPTAGHVRPPTAGPWSPPADRASHRPR